MDSSRRADAPEKVKGHSEKGVLTQDETIKTPD